MSSQKQQTWNILLTPCRNSHPFEPRNISISKGDESSLKIGRAVARVLPTESNAIFDCKVLSRNHAVIWVDDRGRFLIKDTKSSNGTFVNNERLSTSGEESIPREIFTGDILQLGVEIIDSTKKVASGCVICILRVVNDQGLEYATKEINDSPPLISLENGHLSINALNTKCTLVKNEQLFMMSQYVKEAQYREMLLEQKLQTLEEQLSSAQLALSNSWQCLINEEQLLSRIETLEAQLETMAVKRNNRAEEKFRQEMIELQEDKAKAEINAKDSLRQLEENLCEAQMRLHDVENSLTNQEEENILIRNQRQDYETELIKQREQNDFLLEKYNDAVSQLYSLKQQQNTSTDLIKNDTKNDGNINGEISDKKENCNTEDPTVSNAVSETGICSRVPVRTDDHEVFINSIQHIVNKTARTEDLITEIENLIKHKKKIGQNGVKEQEWIEVPPEPSANSQLDAHLSLSKHHAHSSNDDAFQICLLTSLPLLFLLLPLLLLCSRRNLDDKTK